MIAVDKQPHSKLEDELQQAGPQCVVIIPDNFALPVLYHSAGSPSQREKVQWTLCHSEGVRFILQCILFFFFNRIKAMGTLADVHSKDHFTDYTKYMGSADTSRILP